MRIDELLPRWHFAERHCRRTSAAPAALLTAAEEVTWREVTVMRALMRIRSAGLLRLDADRPILDTMATIGFTVLDRTADELVLGAIGRPWAVGRTRPDPDIPFTAFDEPGWAKMIANFSVSDGVLATETRVLLTDARSRRAFRLYWLLIRPFSGLIRRRWLAAIDNRTRVRS
ncbi:MAG TPA: hypothetical protein VFC00_30145 [Micromonosporaceae bacterium]|nr:hypothetical protein [Micromonosporaceae bacterium]